MSDYVDSCGLTDPISPFRFAFGFFLLLWDLCSLCLLFGLSTRYPNLQNTGLTVFFLSFFDFLVFTGLPSMTIDNAESDI